MKAVAYSIKPCEKVLLVKANEKKHDITLISNRLTLETISYAEGKDAVIVFPSDDVSAPVIRKMKEYGVKYIAARSTGTDHIDLGVAAELGIKVANIPVYHPESVAEHAVTLILTLLRNIITANNQMLEYDFTIDNLVGGSIKDKTVGIVGFGKTGRAVAQILRGFGARVIVTDILNLQEEAAELEAEQVSLDELWEKSDIISFHVPLNAQTKYMVNYETITRMKNGVLLINVSRGAIFNSADVLEALNRNKISKIGMDVYEFENNLFFFNHRGKPLDDKLLKAFIQNSRVLVTPHQAFLTREALQVIAEKTINNLDLWNADKCAGEACCCLKECGAAKEAVSI